MLPARESAPGPKEARGWQIGLGGLGCLTMLVGTPIGLAFLGAFIRGHSFPSLAAIGLLLPCASIGLGAWTLRTKRVRVLSSAVAIGAGIWALGLSALLITLGFLASRP
jgi:hypothetical protein